MNKIDVLGLACASLYRMLNIVYLFPLSLTLSQLMQFSTSSYFDVTANYTHRFSSNSHGRIAGRIGRCVC